MDETGLGTGASKRRVTIFYVVLFAAAALAAAFSFSAGEDEAAAPPIAGTYAVEEGSDCLGETFDVKQSGEFVNLTDPDGKVSGSLRFEQPELTGDVGCVDGSTAEIDATVGDETIEGTLDGQPLVATLDADPPPPGTPAPKPPDSITSDYMITPRSACLGGRMEIEEADDGALEVIIANETRGEVTYSEGDLEGTATCAEGGEATLMGEAADRTITLTITPEAPAGEEEEVAAEEEGAAAGGGGGAGPAAEEEAAEEPAAAAAPEKVTATKRREFGETLAHFFIAVVVIMLVARLFGTLAVKLRQPRVMGEVIAGICLGPTLLGAISPELQTAIFPSDIIPFLGVVANLGLIFYMFLVGLELDTRQLKGRVSQAFAISNMSVVFPLVLGIAVAVPIYSLVGPDKEFVAFALFMGVAMSITAFPVLARILVERRMLKRPVGAIAMASAAVDDVTAWFLIALASAVAVAGEALEVFETIGLALVFCAVMFGVIRPVISRASSAYDEAGRVPAAWFAAILAGVLLSAYATESIGIALIFGAFVMGMVMPRHAGLTEDVTGKIEDFVVILLLPLFFTYTGLRTDVGLLDRPELWLLTIALIAVAIIGKLAGAYIAGRIVGFASKPAAVIGILMNTRGLTELIVLNLALEKGVISDALFAALVLMALVTTFMAGPLLRLVDRENEFGAPVEEEFEEARKDSLAAFPAIEVPERSILLAPQDESGLPQLLALAEPMARSEPPREVILARPVLPPRGAAAGVRPGLQTENKLLLEATAHTQEARDRLLADGIAARAVAFISPDPAEDIIRVAERENVDIVLVDGRRPLLGEGVPRGEVGVVLRDTPCDVAVVVAREDQTLAPGPESSIVVPFGGAEHDWAALELGAWIASATKAPLRLLGAAGETEETSKVSRLLADAGLLVQQYAGVAAEPLIAEPGGVSIIESAESAGLLVIGLSPRWREEGLGPTRSEIARAAPAPIAFVRRGSRPGALAPSDEFTHFTWSSPGMVPPGAGNPIGGSSKGGE
ncbi:MAG TPA: cation:proton antiporter [Solirubrobacterales bacterium]